MDKHNAGNSTEKQFLLIFWAVLCLTALSLAVSLYLATVANATEEARRLTETCSTTWKLGFGAVVGLIGGKALR